MRSAVLLFDPQVQTLLQRHVQRVTTGTQPPCNRLVKGRRNVSTESCTRTPRAC
eukprot:m.321926 g.321926  ORF g.321926 m.321926 type:complete len:54 (-) comp20339_c0_seq2:32-193(-)